MRTRPFTYSEVKTWKRCRRKWYLGQHRGLAPVRGDDPTGPARLGTIVHDALEAIYAGEITPDEVARRVRVKVEEDLAAWPDKAEKIEKNGELAAIMVEGYVEWLADEGADEDLDVLGAEEVVSYETDLDGHPITLRSKLDLRVRRRSDGARLFLDHKTVATFEEKIRLLHMDEQMKWYALLDFLTRDEGERTDGALYNMLRKVKRSARAKPPFYMREEQRFSVNVLRSYYAQTLAEIGDILEAEAQLEAGRDPNVIFRPNVTRDCSWDCPFVPVCPMLDDSRSHAESVIRSAYSESDPLARYADQKGTE